MATTISDPDPFGDGSGGSISASAPATITDPDPFGDWSSTPAPASPASVKQTAAPAVVDPRTQDLDLSQTGLSNMPPQQFPATPAPASAAEPAAPAHVWGRPVPGADVDPTGEPIMQEARNAIAANPNQYVGNALPLARDYLPGDKPGQPTGSFHFAMPGSARSVLKGFLDLMEGPATGQMTPEATAALSLIPGAARSLGSPNVGGAGLGTPPLAIEGPPAAPNAPQVEGPGGAPAIASEVAPAAAPVVRPGSVITDDAPFEGPAAPQAVAAAAPPDAMTLRPGTMPQQPLNMPSVNPDPDAAAPLAPVAPIPPMPPPPRPYAAIQQQDGIGFGAAQMVRQQEQQAFQDWHQAYAPGVPMVIPDTGPPLRDAMVKQNELQQLLNDPRPMDQIQQEWNQQDGANLRVAQANMPPGFTVQQQDGKWSLIDPAGNAHVQTPGNWPTEQQASEMVAVANNLAHNSGIDWSQFTREGAGTPNNPVVVRQPTDINAAAARTAEPTLGQAQAGNYRMGHINLGGLQISIENPAGSTRSGVDPGGQPWSVTMPADYGYVKGSTGADGDHVDVYLGPEAHYAQQHQVYVVDQKHIAGPNRHDFDEHKVMLGFPNANAAAHAYQSAFSDGQGPARVGAITAMSFPAFKQWVRQGRTKRPMAYVSPVAQVQALNRAADTRLKPAQIAQAADAVATAGVSPAVAMTNTIDLSAMQGIVALMNMADPASKFANPPGAFRHVQPLGTAVDGVRPAEPGDVSTGPVNAAADASARAGLQPGERGQAVQRGDEAAGAGSGSDAQGNGDQSGRQADGALRRGEPAGEQRTAAAEADPGRLISQIPVAGGDTNPIQAFDPRDIKVDAKRFQFKDGGDDAGVSDRLRGITKWDPLLAGVGIVWKDEAGQAWIADGHQRLALATRLAEDGDAGLRFNAFVLSAENGISAPEARALAAFRNIAEGSGTAIDAAKVIRQARNVGGDLPPLPPRSALVRDGMGLAALGADAFGMAVNDVVPLAQAAIVGRLVAGDADQSEAMRLLAKTKPENARQAEMLVREMLATGTGSASQDSLFGTETTASSIVLERAKIVDEAQRTLAKDKSVFRVLVRDAKQIETAGNTLDPNANSQRLTTDEQAAQYLTQLATRKGPVSDALSAIARRYKGAELTRAAAAREFLDVVRHAMEQGGERGHDVGGAVAGDAGAGQEPPQLGFFEQPSPPLGKSQFLYEGDVDEIDTIPKENGDVHAQAAAWVLQRFADDGLEHLALVDNQLGQITTAKNSGLDDFLRLAQNDLGSAPDRFTAHHNHPRGRSLSRQDLLMLAARGLSHVAAHTTENTFVASLSPQLRAEGRIAVVRGAIATAYRGAWNDVRAFVQDAVNAGAIDLKSALQAVEDLVNRVVAADGVIEYKSSLPVHPALLPGLTKVLRAHGVPADGYDRSTQLSGRDASLGSLRQEVRGQSGDAEPAGSASGPGGGEGLSGGAQAQVGHPNLWGDADSDVDGASYDLPTDADGLAEEGPLAEITDRPSFEDRLRRLPKVGNTLATLAAKAADVNTAIMQMTAPMGQGSVDARAFAKDFANARRWVRWQGNQVDRYLEKTFTPEQRLAMWTAADLDSVALQTGEAATARSNLPEPQRAALETLQQAALEVFERAKALGIAKGDPLPSYVPRMVVGIGMPEGAAIVRDIRTLALATASLNEAIAGRMLINRIKFAGMRAGKQSVAEGEEPAPERAGQDINQSGPTGAINPITGVRTTTPQMRRRNYTTAAETEAAANRIPEKLGDGWFTIPQSPAFWVTQYDGVDQEGEPRFKRVPLLVSKEFEWPLRAVLRKPNNMLYRGIMSMKGSMMGLIMYGVAHLGVISARSLPSAKGNPVRLIQMAREGNVVKRDINVMQRAISNGLVPIGRDFQRLQDATGIQASPIVQPGESWTAQILGALARPAGQAASTAVKRGVDKAGHFVHNTLLWDRVADIQAGIFVTYERKMLAEGHPAPTASKIAAHLANRYAGALPQEAMSQNAEMLANLLLFSRTYRMTGAGAIKDMFKGLPPDVLAQIERESGIQAMKKAKTRAQRLAIATILIDMALFYAGNSILQSTLNVLALGKSVGTEAMSYEHRAAAELQHLFHSPASALNPFGVLQSLTPMAEHEPGKENRLLIGYEKDGTGVYARNPFGKFAEDVQDYMTQPVATISSTVSPFVRDAQAVFNRGGTGPGGQVYDPYANTPGQVIGAIADVALQFMSNSGPSTAVQAAKKLATGQGGGFQAGQIGMGAFGVSLSHGFPGGPQLGELNAVSQEHKFQVARALPAIRDQIKAGDTAGAVAAMGKLGMRPNEIKFVMVSTLQPHMGVRQLQRFLGYATPEAMQRVMPNLAP